MTERENVHEAHEIVLRDRPLYPIPERDGLTDGTDVW